MMIEKGNDLDECDVYRRDLLEMLGWHSLGFGECRSQSTIQER